MPRSHAAALANVDLNLLVILRELLREQNVTRAAERVGVTQPAASAALARLRRHFDDDLLERTRGGFVLSPLGRQLAVQVEPLCLGLERLFTPESPFEPESSDHEFSIMATDYVLSAMGEALSRAMHAIAPRVRLHVRVVKRRLPADLPEALRSVDGIISAPKAEFKVDDLCGQELFRDRWVCVVDAANPVGDRIGLADLERMPWVIPNHPDGPYPASSPLAPLLGMLTTRPRVAVRVDSYAATPWFVAGTDRVAVMQGRLAAAFSGRPDLRVLECPGQPPPIVEIFWWHQRRTGDAAHTWLRAMLDEAARPLRDDGTATRA